jgi:hypothetical protein
MSRFRLKHPALRLSENDVERQCIDTLGVRQYKVVRQHVGTFQRGNSWVKIGELGLPDYIATHPLYPAIYMEVKRPGAKPSLDQERKHLELQVQRMHVVTIDHVEALVAWLDEHQRKIREQWYAYATNQTGNLQQ